LCRLVVEVLGQDIQIDVFESVVKYKKEQGKADKMSVKKKANLSESKRKPPFNTAYHISLLLRENEHDMTRAYDYR
jgi:hypothetical protein